MGMEYEVRPEYKSFTLSRLLDAPVTCFQGVGDPQSEILRRVFHVRTVRQLANLPYYLWALGIQEFALHDEAGSTAPIAEIPPKKLKFSLKEAYKTSTARELLDSPIHVFEGLTPAEDLSLYDSFRITTVLQLAHNRIMLEARLIEFLEKNPNVDVTGSDLEIASLLLSDATIPDAALAKLRLEGKDPKLSQMTNDLTDHLLGRIEVLRKKPQDGPGARRLSPAEMAQTRRLESKRRMELIMEQRNKPVESRADEIRQRAAATGVTGGGSGAGSGTASGSGPAKAGADQAQSQPPVSKEDPLAHKADHKADKKGRPGKKSSPLPWVGAAAAAALVIGVGVMVLKPGEQTHPEKSSQNIPEDGEPSGGQNETSPADRVDSTGPAMGGGQTDKKRSPEKAAETTTGKTGRAAGEGDLHTVKPGENLWKISSQHLETPKEWPQIYQENKKTIRDPNLIYPKQKIKIPPKNQ